MARKPVFISTSVVLIQLAAIAFCLAGPCDEEAKRLCPGVPAGEGRIARCLAHHPDQLCLNCKGFLIETGFLKLPIPLTLPEKNQISCIPLAYRSTYGKLKEILDDLDSLLLMQDTVRGKPVTYAAELLIANCNRGSALLKPQALTGVIAYLDSFKKLGIQGVTIAIHYPLYTPFFPDYQKYVAFYKRVAVEVRKRGMKMDIEAHIIFANTSFSDLKINYAGLTFEQYKKEAKAMVQTIINDLAPDYINIIAEPDTAAILTGLNEFHDPRKCTEFVNYVLQDLNKGKTKLIAGVGNWGDMDVVKSIAANTRVDCIGIHVYPIFGKSLENLFLAADIARQYHKGLVIDEAWLYKTDKNPGSGDSAWTELFRSDMFSFWEPLDQQFLASMVRITKLLNVEYFSAFWSNYFFAYLNYNSDNADLPYKTLSTFHHKKEVTSLLADTFTSTGLFFKQLINDNP